MSCSRASRLSSGFLIQRQKDLCCRHHRKIFLSCGRCSFFLHNFGVDLRPFWREKNWADLKAVFPQRGHHYLQPFLRGAGHNRIHLFDPTNAPYPTLPAPAHLLPPISLPAFLPPPVCQLPFGRRREGGHLLSCRKGGQPCLRCCSWPRAVQTSVQ